MPVPQTLGLCEDASVIGTPFFVMRFVAGTIYWDPTLPELPDSAARAMLYDEYIASLAKLHQVDYVKVGLGDYGKVSGYVARQVDRWSKQYEASRTSEIPAMESLMRWIREDQPKSDETTLIHGDYRIDNIMFEPGDAPRALAIIDWELSTLGHPISDLDLAYACMGYHLNLPGRGGLSGVDVAALGIPNEQALIDAYCKLTGRSEIPDWPYFMAFGIFRLAAIAQGVYKRSLQGNASSDNASMYGAAVNMLRSWAAESPGSPRTDARTSARPACPVAPFVACSPAPSVSVQVPRRRARRLRRVRRRRWRTTPASGSASLERRRRGGRRRNGMTVGVDLHPTLARGYVLAFMTLGVGGDWY